MVKKNRWGGEPLLRRPPPVNFVATWAPLFHSAGPGREDVAAVGPTAVSGDRTGRWWTFGEAPTLTGDPERGRRCLFRTCSKGRARGCHHRQRRHGGSAVADLVRHRVGALVVSPDGRHHRRDRVGAGHRPAPERAPRRVFGGAGGVHHVHVGAGVLAGDDVESIMNLMTEQRIRHVPVVRATTWPASSASATSSRAASGSWRRTATS